MSWVKKRGQAAPNATPTPPSVQMYNPNQHSTQENQWQQQQQARDNSAWYSQQTVQQPPQQTNNSHDPTKPYWQNPQTYQQEYAHGQYHDQANYYQNNTAYQQQQQQQQQQSFNSQQQAYGNLQYNQQFTAQNNVYQAPSGGQAQKANEGDAWGSNWGWGDEDNSNVQAATQPQLSEYSAPQPTANVAESFTNDESWNWPKDDPNSQQQNPTETIDFPKAPLAVDRLTGKRGKLETPQWSVDSQLSQESSDEVIQTSESDKSRMLSRSSTISGQDLPPHDDIVESKEEKQQFENREIVSQLKQADASLPPPNAQFFPPGNVYQRSAGLSHKSSSKYRASNSTPPELRPPSVPTPQSVNLETLPDNAEQPDQAPPNNTTEWPENNEAPINDRNQYLETGQLSNLDQNFFSSPQMGETDDALPPPGLRRLVLGQIQQTESNSQNELPPEGLRRLIPGESSSPEVNARQIDDYSEPELNEVGAQRSATIGADTPPSQSTANRSETIGAAANSPDLSTSTDNNRSKGNKNTKKRRDSIEGQTEGDLVGSLRNLAVSDSVEENKDSTDRRRLSRESSDSEDEEPRRKVSSERRRYKDDGRVERDVDRNRSRYSPDHRDKKYQDRRSHRYKERRYDDDVDYYSDREREKKLREEYDRKYGSLSRRDNKKEKERGRGEYGRETRKGDYYYGGSGRDNYDGYDNEMKSRASSRSDSVHDSYRERRGGGDRDERERRERRHKEKERHRRHRGDPRADHFNSYAQGFGYDMYNQYYQQYHYYENLRKTNPQAYAQWYRKYYQNSAHGEAPSFTAEDRASVHSGRSSANDELAKDRYTRQSYYSHTSLPHIGSYYRGSQTQSISGQYGLDESSFAKTLDPTDQSLNEDYLMQSQRLTPAKYATAHIKASISSGKLVKVLPHYPIDGQPPSVEVCSLESFLCNDEEYQELKRFPGPLVKGATHKKTILEYCERKIKNASYNLDIIDQDSYILMWELLMLLIKQNGMVVGADIAELLLKNRSEDVVQARPASIVSSVSSNNVGEMGEAGSASSELTQMKEEEITKKFREYLLYGSGKEALEWAMKHGLWGHALFLASKLDKRTYGNVLIRFANGLTMNDPLQTLYQLLSGKTPAAVTCVADEKWGDWRPHLAMILSNTTQRPELNCKAITLMGDTLMNRGSLYSAQFCYLMAEVGFSDYANPDAKLVLLGSDHNKPFLHFAINDAIQMTEIYEYACSLNNDQFMLPSFQRYKYLLATRLADVGLLERSLAYLEKIATFIVTHQGLVDANVIDQVATLADRLKYNDPVADVDDDPSFDANLDVSRPDNSWLKELRQIQNDYNTGLCNENAAFEQTLQSNQQAYEQVWQQQPQQWNLEQTQKDNTPTEYQQPAQSQLEGYPTNQEQQQQQYWTAQQQQQQQQQQPQQWSDVSPIYNQETVEQTQPNYYGALPQDKLEVDTKPVEEIPPLPQISLPNHQQQSNPPHDQPSEPKKPQAPSKARPQPPAQEKTTGNGWFGFFGKLSLKPKNQMKLPDDKNPSIVWDPDKKRWVNTDGDASDPANDFKPPPRMSVPAPNPPANSFANPSIPAPGHLGAPGEPNGNIPKIGQPGNMFKMQGRGRNLKKSYVDVFNPNGKAGSIDANSSGQAAAMPQMNFFVPQPVSDPNAPTDFLTPAPPMQYDENAQIQS